jgi:hypothetical protein
MSKWKSETFELESKSQLKAHRKHKFDELLMDNDLDLLNYSFWSQAEKDLEILLWKEADDAYEIRKDVLRPQLTALITNDLVKYFQEIGVPESSVEDYLPESPV